MIDHPIPLPLKETPSPLHHAATVARKVGVFLDRIGSALPSSKPILILSAVLWSIYLAKVWL